MGQLLSTSLDNPTSNGSATLQLNSTGDLPVSTNTLTDGDYPSATNAINYPNDLSGPTLQSITTTTTTTTNPYLVNEANNTLYQQGTQTPHGNNDEFSVKLFGTVLYPSRWLTLTTLTSWLEPMSSLAMIIGCVLPYVPQYTTIHRTRSCSGFSTFVCLTLLLANILRIAFWFGHRFELPLLIQSIVMILVQILLLELCVRVKRWNSSHRTQPLVKQFLNPKYFWRWTDLANYLVFLIIITTLLGGAVYCFIDKKPFIESLGYCALVIESMLGLPQVIRNYRKKSVEGMSLSMVLMWLAGDIFKTGYYIKNAVPYQFWLCGLLQITIDIIILFQVCLFKRRSLKMSSSA